MTDREAFTAEITEKYIEPGYTIEHVGEKRYSYATGVNTVRETMPVMALNAPDTGIGRADR